MTAYLSLCSLIPSVTLELKQTMTMNPLPPQAYTKETLLKAYQWLMGQNTSLKEMATTPDILVSLFLKATRDGDHALERPSIINFKNELKSLAGMMTELDRNEVAKPRSTPEPRPQVETRPHPTSQPEPFNQPLSNLSAPNPQRLHSEARQQPELKSIENSFSSPGLAEEQNFLGDLDLDSLKMIREVKNDFNLSCEKEALRMLIKIGFVRAKGLLK